MSTNCRLWIDSIRITYATLGCEGVNKGKLYILKIILNSFLKLYIKRKELTPQTSYLINQSYRINNNYFQCKCSLMALKEKLL